MKNRRNIWLGLLAVAVIAGGAAMFWHRSNDDRAKDEMLSLLPNDVPKHPDLVRAAADIAKHAYAANCASCHGADMRGNAAIGAPNLADHVWLYNTNSVFDIEQTILYGIRSGHSKSHNLTVMTAFGLSGKLSPAEIRDVVQYVLSLNRRPNIEASALSGRNIYFGKANCVECHGEDAKGDPDYGAPDLTINTWNNGGDANSLYRSIYFGLHRSCPGWYGKLPLGDIRALAVYLHSLSEQQVAQQPSPAG